MSFGVRRDDPCSRKATGQAAATAEQPSEAAQAAPATEAEAAASGSVGSTGTHNSQRHSFKFSFFEACLNKYIGRILFTYLVSYDIGVDMSINVSRCFFVSSQDLIWRVHI